MRRPPTLTEIIDAVCSRMWVTAEDLRGPERWRTVVQARAMVVYLARRLTHASYPDIAKELHKSHSSLIQAEGLSKFRGEHWHAIVLQIQRALRPLMSEPAPKPVPVVEKMLVSPPARALVYPVVNLTPDDLGHAIRLPRWRVVA